MPQQPPAEKIRVHPSARLIQLFIGGFLVVLTLMAFFLWEFAWFDVLWRVVFGAGVIYLAYLYLSRITSIYEINPIEVSMEIGIFNKRRKTAPINRITNVELNRSLIKRILGLADLHVDTPGGADIELDLTEMDRADAEAFSKLLAWHIGTQKVADADDNVALKRSREAAVKDIVSRPESL